MDDLPPFAAPPAPRPDDLVLRAARAQDAEMLAELANLPGYRWGTLRLPFQTLEETRRWVEAPSPGMVNLVALSGGQLVGQAGLNRPQGRRAHVGQIGMGVHDRWVGRGIGTALLRALVDTADRWLGLRRLELTVFTDNAPALALYHRFGFAVEGTHRAYALRDGRYVDAHAMARLVPGPAD